MMDTIVTVVTGENVLYVVVAGVATIVGVLVRELFGRRLSKAKSTDVYSMAWERSMKQMSAQLDRMSTRVLELEQENKDIRRKFELRDAERMAEITGLKAKVSLLEGQMGNRRKEDQ